MHTLLPFISVHCMLMHIAILLFALREMLSYVGPEDAKVIPFAGFPQALHLTLEPLRRYISVEPLSGFVG